MTTFSPFSFDAPPDQSGFSAKLGGATSVSYIENEHPAKFPAQPPQALHSRQRSYEPTSREIDIFMQRELSRPYGAAPKDVQYQGQSLYTALNDRIPSRHDKIGAYTTFPAVESPVHFKDKPWLTDGVSSTPGAEKQEAEPERFGVTRVVW